MNLNCAINLANPATLITPLSTGVVYSGTIPDLFTGAYFTFTTTIFETIAFTTNISPNTSQAIDGAFTLFILDNGTFINLGSSILDTFSNQFTYAAQSGEYYICLSSHNSVDFSISGEFTPFPTTAEFQLQCLHGAIMPDITFSNPPSICDSEIVYSFISGELPVNVNFATNGFIAGFPEEQDCHVDDTTPSFTWHEKAPDSEEQTSTGHDYLFTIRATLVDYPGTFVDRQFFITVYNNWTVDLLHIQSQREKWVVDRFVYEEDLPNSNKKPALANTQPEPVLVAITPELVATLCDTCPEPEAFVQPTLSELKELAKKMVILEEFSELITINDEGLCVVCPPVEEVTSAPVIAPLKLEEIIGCAVYPPIEIPSTELVSLPVTMCPPCDVEVSVVATVVASVIVPGLPEICYIDLLERMRTEKICDGRPICEPVLDIYPAPKNIEIKKDNDLTEILVSSCPRDSQLPC